MPTNTIRQEPSGSDLLRSAHTVLGQFPECAPHGQRVARLAVALFDALGAFHGLETCEREFLEAAALLHDLGRPAGRRRHHKVSRDLIVEANLVHEEKHGEAIVACVARYHRKRFPRPTHKIYRDLIPAHRLTVRKLAAILRIADGLERPHLERIPAMRAQWTERSCVVLIREFASSSVRVQGGLRERGLFEQVFARRLDIRRIALAP